MLGRRRDMRDELFTLNPFVILTLYFHMSLLHLNIAGQSLISGCRWMKPPHSHWPLHGPMMTCPSMTNGRGPWTRSCSSFTLLRSGALLYSCFLCLDLLFGCTLLYLVLTRLLPCIYLSLSYLVCLPSLHSYFFVLYLDLLFALLASCNLFHFSFANVHLRHPHSARKI